MRLSEAIRLGSMLGSQAFGHGFGDNGETCAHGAALLAIGRKGAWYTENMDHWPWTTYTRAECPGCRSFIMVFSAIRELNDMHKWTRERIAEWVSTIEPKEEPEVEVFSCGGIGELTR